MLINDKSRSNIFILMVMVLYFLCNKHSASVGFISKSRAKRILNDVSNISNGDTLKLANGIYKDIDNITADEGFG